MNHVHVETSLWSMVATGVIYLLAWLFSWSIPQVIYYLPGVITIFIGCYLVLYIPFFIIWNR